MAGVTQCPSCGEDENLRGTPCRDDIQINCLTCGATWMRGAPRCAGCGGQDIVGRPQSMTRHSRGTQLSIIGWREVSLCRTCDRDALETSIAQNTPVPGDYVPASLFGNAEPPTTPPPASAPSGPPASQPAPARTVGPAPGREQAPRQRAARPAQAPKERSRPRPAPSAVPTVRQAIAAFLTEASGGTDSTAMLLLGTHLGSYERLSVLDTPDAAGALATWCQGHWGDGSRPGAQNARDTILRAVDFWGAKGWLTSDPAAGLRVADT